MDEAQTNEAETNYVEAEDHLGMTPEQWEQFQAFTRGFGEQSESGVDISLLRANLKLTPTERIERMRHALANYLEVRHARTIA